MYLEMLIRAGLAEVALARGDLDGARALALAVIAATEASETEDLDPLITPRFVLARVEAASGNFDQARALAQDALAEYPGMCHALDYKRTAVRTWLAELDAATGALSEDASWGRIARRVAE